MDEKKFLKEVLKTEMPDLEEVRRNCINQEIPKKATVSSLWVKRVAPAAACLAVVLISVIIGNSINKSDNGIVLKGESFTSVSSNADSKNNGEKSTQDNKIAADKTDKNHNNETVIKKTDSTENTEKIATSKIENGNQLATVDNHSNLSTTFNTVDEMVENAKEFKTIDEINTAGNSEFSEYKFTMILNDRFVYKPSFNVGYLLKNGSLESSGDYKFNLFSNKYKRNVVFMYNTYKSSVENKTDTTVTNKNGKSFHYAGDNAYWYVDQYKFYVELGGDATESDYSSFIEGLALEKVNLD